MVSQTNEQALEAAIEKHLTGVTTETYKAGDASETAENYAATNNGFHIGLPEHFDKQYAIDTHFFWQFLETTQEQELAKLKKYNPNDWQRKILERYDRLIKKHGILHLLKKGLSVDNAHFHLLYPAPLASSSEKIHQQFQSNIF